MPVAWTPSDIRSCTPLRRFSHDCTCNIGEAVTFGDISNHDVCCHRDSHVLVSKILLILGTELYGYNFTEVEGPDWGEAIFVGIQADLWDINLEAWRVGDQLLDPKWAPVASSYGPIGYHILFEIDV